MFGMLSQHHPAFEHLGKGGVEMEKLGGLRRLGDIAKGACLVWSWSPVRSYGFLQLFPTKPSIPVNKIDIAIRQSNLE